MRVEGLACIAAGASSRRAADLVTRLKSSAMEAVMWRWCSRCMASECTGALHPRPNGPLTHGLLLLRDPANAARRLMVLFPRTRPVARQGRSVKRRSMTRRIRSKIRPTLVWPNSGVSAVLTCTWNTRTASDLLTPPGTTFRKQSNVSDEPIPPEWPGAPPSRRGGNLSLSPLPVVGNSL